MLGDTARERKIKELVELANISDIKLEKLNYKEKQAYYRAKSKLGKVFYKGDKPYVRRGEK